MPDSQSVTVAEAGRLWLKTSEAAGLERSTLSIIEGFSNSISSRSSAR